MYRYKLILCCLCLANFSTATKAAEGNFEDAELVNEFVTMSFSSSHPYDLRHTIPGEPDIDYPIYSTVPRTSFDCNGRHDGYYADVETRCQVFRICANTDLIGRGFAFLCPNGTLFSQKNFVCDWYRNVDCNDSERYYNRNDGNRIGSKAEIMETVRQMMEHPMKTISVALNRGKPITPQPSTYHRPGVSTTNDPKSFGNAAAQNRNIPSQQVFSRRPPVTLNQIESAAGLPQRNQPTNGVFDPLNASAAQGVRSSQASYTTPSVPLFGLTPTATPLSATNESPSQVQEASLQGIPSVTGQPSFTTESSADEKEVYVSNLGELSTDPESNFNPQTARIIAEPTSSSLDVQVTSESSSRNKLNFAGKVNAGLNGLQVVNKNEIIAPEYVQNILQQNIPTPRDSIEPPSYEFASNVNSLLDEVAYETELEGQTSMQVQLRTPSEGNGGSTRKPFRFLSRGFSYDNIRPDGSYSYGPPTAQRSAFARMQHSTSTQSYSNSYFRTPLFTTPAPVATTEAVHSSFSEYPSEESIISLNAKLATPSAFGGRAANELTQAISPAKVQSGTKDASINLRFDAEAKSEPETESKPEFKREQKDESKQSNVNTLNDIPQDDKAGANKRAEKLLIAGFKQTILDNFGTKNDADDLEDTSPIVPLYIRVPELPSTAFAFTSTTPSTTTLTTPLTKTSTTPSTTILTTLSITTSTARPSTTAQTGVRSRAQKTKSPSVAPPTPLTTTTQSLRSYTVGNVHRRQTSRSTPFPRRNNLVRAGLRASTTSTTTTTTTARPAGSRQRITPSPTTTTLRPSDSPRRRKTVSRYSISSRRRGGNSTSTTTQPPNKKLAVRSSEKDMSDLAAVASTYNAAPKREYNSIRQDSYKYVQTHRRRPTHTSEATTITTTPSSTTTTPTTTTQYPGSSPSLPIATLAPFSHEASSFSTSSTTPAPLPATFLSFTDLTKAIIDDSILQTFRRNQDNIGSTLRPQIVLTQPQAPLRPQGISVTTSRSQERSAQRVVAQTFTTRQPHIPLKDFIASKFGAHYSPAPPKLSSPRPTILPTSTPINGLLARMQNQAAYAPLYPTQQYNIRQDSTPRNILTVTPAPALQHIVQQQQLQQQNVVAQHPQFVIQQAPRQQSFTFRQHQGAPVQQFVHYQQQVVQPTAQPVIYRSAQQQPLQVVPSVQQPAYRFQQQVVQRIPNQQRSTIQQGQQILQRTIPSVQQQQVQQQQVQQFQRTQQLQAQRSPVPVQQQHSQIQIFPSHMTAAQTIPAQSPNPNISPEVGSINVRLPTNLAGLIPSTNLFGLSEDSRAQKRIDQIDAQAENNESKSVYSGVSSYDVPLSSVGRLANDITHLLRRLRRL